MQDTRRISATEMKANVHEEVKGTSTHEGPGVRSKACDERYDGNGPEIPAIAYYRVC